VWCGIEIVMNMDEPDFAESVTIVAYETWEQLLTTPWIFLHAMQGINQREKNESCKIAAQF
jgi:hypothetical protein